MKELSTNESSIIASALAVEYKRIETDEGIELLYPTNQRRYDILELVKKIGGEVEKQFNLFI